MEEKNTNPNEKNESKKKQNGKESLSDICKDPKAEFKKIVWPKRAEVGKKTVTVLVTSLIMSVVIFAMDSVFTLGHNLLVNLIK